MSAEEGCEDEAVARKQGRWGFVLTLVHHWLVRRETWDRELSHEAVMYEPSRTINLILLVKWTRLAGLF